MKTAHLVLNGNVNVEFLRKVISIPIFCTDGAYDKLMKSEGDCGLEISGVIGDFDSVNWDSVKARKIPMRNQNFTDFEKALFFLSKRFDKIIVYGANGDEMDHVLGNLHAAKKFAKKVVFLDEKSKYFFAPKKLVLTDVLGKTISLIPFPIARSVKTFGLKWKLSEDLILGKKISIRNKAIKNNVKINFYKGSLVIVIS